MKIQQWVRNFMESPGSIYARGGAAVTAGTLQREYRRIRACFLTRCADSSIVALYLEKDYRYLLSLLACMEIGLTYIPLRREWPDSRIEQIRRLSNFTLLLTDALVEEAIASEAPPVSRNSFAIAADKPLYIMFTSGSTGEPKGAIIERHACENFFEWLDAYLPGINPQDRLLNSTDFTFDVSLVDVGLLLLKRPGFFLSDFRDDFFRLLGELDAYRISVIATVPNNFSMMLSDRLAGRADLSSLRHVLIAGSRFPYGLYQAFRKHLAAARIYNCYGPTEATVYCIVKALEMNEAGDLAGQNVSIGVPIANCDVLLLDPEQKPVGTNQEGEIYIGGRQLMRSYLNNAVESERSLCVIQGKRYYRSGDMAFRDGRGELYVIGRADDTIKISGQRVNLSDVEAYVQRLNYVNGAAVVAVPHAQKEYLMYLFVVLNTPKEPQAILSDLKEVLLKHQLPHKIRILEQFPQNNSGKTCKKTLLASCSSGA